MNEEEIRAWVLNELEMIVQQGSWNLENGPSADAQNEMRDIIREIADGGGY
tara:strand:- start:1799 stop:1951 length:153 start_codon:yes stop_codon:yes gene_type:complete